MTNDNAPLVNEPEPHGKQGKLRNLHAWFLGILLGAVLTVVLVGALVWLSTGIGLLGLLRGGGTQINVGQPTVVRQIQQLQRLETVSYAMDKIISGDHPNPYRTKFSAGYRYRRQTGLNYQAPRFEAL
jgi:hypothetical protein